jgi:hypothetical protein
VQVEAAVLALRRDELPGRIYQSAADTVSAEGGGHVHPDELRCASAGVAVGEPGGIGGTTRSALAHARRAKDSFALIDSHPQAVPGIVEVNPLQVVDVPVPLGQVAVTEVLVEDAEHELPGSVEIGGQRRAYGNRRVSHASNLHDDDLHVQMSACHWCRRAAPDVPCLVDLRGHVWSWNMLGMCGNEKRRYGQQVGIVMTETQQFRRAPQRSPIAGALVMLGLSILLVWLPLLGPLIAGYVGGRVVGSGGMAFLVALLPAIALGFVVVGLLAFFDLPLLGAVAGASSFLVIAVQDIPLLLGAYAGGAVAR